MIMISLIISYLNGNLLKSPNQETRELFSTSYLENVNLIGSTGSSIENLILRIRHLFFHSYECV